MDQVNSILELQEFFSKLSEEDTMKYLIDEGFLNKLKECTRCHKEKVLRRNISYKGSYAAYCKKCRKFRSLLIGTFFEDTHVPFHDIFYMLWCWAAHASISCVVALLNFRAESVGHYYKQFRSIAAQKMASMPTLQLGGPGHVVQVDESIICKTGSGVQRWIFGMVDTTTNRGALRFVEQKDAQTRISIIQQHVLPGSELWSDGWTAYSSLESLGFNNPASGYATSTNAVVSYWAKLMRFCRSTDVLKSNLMEEHLNEFMWREEFCRNKKTGEIFSIFLRHLKEKYSK